MLRSFLAPESDPDQRMDVMVVRNHCAHERVDPLFAPLVAAARAGMLACCGAQVREIRLQGSIARGEARPGVADLDMMALLDGPPTPSQAQCMAELAEILAAGTRLVARFDLEAVDANTLAPFRRFVLSSDSLCIYGRDTLTAAVQTMERGALARLVTPDPETMVPDYLAWADELTSAADDERRFASRIIGKDLLKVLRGVALLRGAAYEVSIARIEEVVRDHVPEAADVAGRCFALYVEPTSDVDSIQRAVASATSLLERTSEVASLRAGTAGVSALELDSDVGRS